jgi:hypothetical protein
MSIDGKSNNKQAILIYEEQKLPITLPKSYSELIEVISS